ncbi:heme/hemin ABC transporter substrate-binding protein [Pseudomonas lopnurensis]|uniref:heme/hemin ABC transporter substrate-binding protein n=1 Tax=Pseudomonas lopnurensis TaxID=1477517 RepID=UPI0018798CB3|nr:helical backbone metal receptor [Pseudomonas lopnurensis]MBE7373977.1 ABC transporter substrate-binding protein [Pseudomonas lopnurensis]
MGVTNGRVSIGKRRLGAALALLAALAWLPGAPADDALPQRWVSAGGSLSEWVVALGGADRLVGVDTTSLHPTFLQDLPSIGYQRQLAAEGILALRPDLLLGSEEMGPPPVLQQLRAAGVRIETLSAQADLATLEDNLTRLGALLGEPQRARQALAAFRSRIESQQAWIAEAQRSQEAPGVVLLLGHPSGSAMAGGRDTAAAWLIEQAGGRNLTRHSGYKALSSEALLALDPDVVIFTDRRLLEADEARQALMRQNPALASTRAAREGRMVALDPTLLVGGLGPRIPEGLAALSAAFYPARSPLPAEATPDR